MSAEPGSEHKRPTEGPRHSCDIHRNTACTSCTASEWKDDIYIYFFKCSAVSPFLPQWSHKRDWSGRSRCPFLNSATRWHKQRSLTHDSAHTDWSSAPRGITVKPNHLHVFMSEKRGVRGCDKKNWRWSVHDSARLSCASWQQHSGDDVSRGKPGMVLERCVDGAVDQEVAVLYTGELTNCLWAEKGWTLRNVLRERKEQRGWCNPLKGHSQTSGTW